MAFFNASVSKLNIIEKKMDVIFPSREKHRIIPLKRCRNIFNCISIMQRRPVEIYFPPKNYFIFLSLFLRAHAIYSYLLIWYIYVCQISNYTNTSSKKRDSLKKYDTQVSFLISYIC